MHLIAPLAFMIFFWACAKKEDSKVKTETELRTTGAGTLVIRHLDDICNKTISNKDRVQMLYRKLSKDTRGLTRDEFFGMLLDGKVAI